jgi:phage repressor protein C with HTH and peptisase S24 domain
MAKHSTVLVDGNSMVPTYNPGDWLMARWGDYSVSGFSLFRNKVRVGDAVVVERAEQPGVFYIKRILEIDLATEKYPKIYVLSDNPEGTDSRTWGWLPLHYVKARVEFRVKKKKVKRG